MNYEWVRSIFHFFLVCLGVVITIIYNKSKQKHSVQRINNQEKSGLYVSGIKKIDGHIYWRVTENVYACENRPFIGRDLKSLHIIKEDGKIYKVFDMPIEPIALTDEEYLKYYSTHSQKYNCRFFRYESPPRSVLLVYDNDFKHEPKYESPEEIMWFNFS